MPALCLTLLGSFFLSVLINSFIKFWLCWVISATRGLSLVAASRGYSSLQWVGFSLQWALLLQSTGSRALGLPCLKHVGSVVATPGL